MRNSLNTLLFSLLLLLLSFTTKASSSSQTKYTKDVVAAGRVAGRHGLKKKPTSMVEVGLLVLNELHLVRGTMEGMLDVMRGEIGVKQRSH